MTIPWLAPLYRAREVRYQPADRDVFRPLQYVDMEFRAAIRFGEMEWRARDIVEMASLHVESLIKRIGRVGRMPLGAALGNVLVQRRVDAVTYRRIADTWQFITPRSTTWTNPWERTSSQKKMLYVPTLFAGSWLCRYIRLLGW